MSKTYQGASLLRKPIRKAMPARCGSFIHHQLDLASMRGEVHRFEGIVDRIGTAPKATGVVETICIRDLIHCRTNQRINPDHWWFRLRQEWMDARIKPGDHVVFIAKVQRCSKGTSYHEVKGKRERIQVIGFGATVKSLIIKESASDVERQPPNRRNLPHRLGDLGPQAQQPSPACASG
jgi:hypothetical protein